MARTHGSPKLCVVDETTWPPDLRHLLGLSENSDTESTAALGELGAFPTPTVLVIKSACTEAIRASAQQAPRHQLAISVRVSKIPP
jgi:hypothetical protein